MPKTKFHIDLTEEETALLGEIDLRAKHPDHNSGREAYLSNQKPILALLGLLSERRAIPEVRLKWWNDPRYNSGRIKSSRKGLFERNGCSGADIYVHPHFIPHLRYFLFGADLPETIVDAFEQRVGNPEWISSSDVVPLGKHARDLCRKAGLDKATAAEEFFKLSLDLGLGLTFAEGVVSGVKQLR
ncbi:MULTISPECIES: hypothetical protein [unclassified Ensifer]|uniref:hypothetical protein n=1 Tax=unclassified Ensifer TaxID=2633371 RepID=UPI00070F76BA|nr:MULTISPECIES: hypothetical protein [unclassified Ensifer]KQW47197.1 hypothetical protein ASD02_34395 [Ensifer sp. Root1252]KRC68749.1 hypothetical protein ASE32_35225 [Ensifer sp. Root231]KRC93915.1 hypothetical protein ASE47_34890 [Ensifer sp. Root258]